MSRAAPPRELELVLVGVDRDDDPGTGQPRARDHLKTDAAAPDHADAGADAHAGAVDGADPGHDAAAEQRGLPQRNRTGSLTAPAAGTTAYSAKHATIKPCWSTVPSAARRREVPSISIPATPFLAGRLT